MIQRFSKYFFILAAAYFCCSCSDPVTGAGENRPPQTYLSIFPDSIIAPGSTLKKITWWADDPDGFVAGFRVSLDSINWSFTTKNDSTFLFVISGNDSTFKVFVSAVDDKGAIDPTPASNLYPVINTAPSMVFDGGTEVPDTTFPVATFKWTGTDPDGSSSIRYYYWAINDTANFRRIPATQNTMTLTRDSGLVLNGNNKLYMKAQDNAGAFSPVVSMPDTGSWYVKAVTSRVLLLKDMPPANMPAADAYFQSAMDTVDYDVLDIKSNNGALIPRIVNPMFIETLKLFKVVIWSGGSGTNNTANFSLAEQSLPFYIQAGGRVLFSSGFSSTVTQGQGGLVNFAPIDSATSCSVPFYLSSDSNLIVKNNTYPVIGPSAATSPVKGLYIQDPNLVIYSLYKPQGCFDTLDVVVKDLQSSPRVVYFAMPMYNFNRDVNGSKAFIRRVFEEFAFFNQL